MSGFDDFLSAEIGQNGHDGRDFPSNPVFPPYNPIGSNPQLDRMSRPLCPFCPLGADPHDTEERHAIQQEGNEISDLPDKPILSLAEQAALVLEGYNGDRDRAAADLRTVARNFALADYVEAGNAAPQPILAEITLMTPDRGWDDVPGFEGMPDLTPSEHGVILHRLMNPAQEASAPAVESYPSTTPPEKMQHGADMAQHSASAIVTCGTCAEFEPGTPAWGRGIGRCSRTANGLPPVASRGYGACFPDAPRTCPDYKELT